MKRVLNSCSMPNQTKSSRWLRIIGVSTQDHRALEQVSTESA
jgi:hypothetical protein